MPKTDIIIIIPTYNEEGNIENCIRLIKKQAIEFDILVVDDNSTDKTQTIIKKLQKELPGIELLARDKKYSLGDAYLAGFKHVLKKHYNYIYQMDADLSHNPDDLPRLLQPIKDKTADLVIGSRYCRGISIVNWPLTRLILSYAANLYARIVTGLPIKDTTAGFKCIHRDVLEHITLNHFSTSGYAFQIELIFKAWKAGYKLKEIDVIFRERLIGTSKMSLAIIGEAIWKVWILRLRAIFRTL